MKPSAECCFPVPERFRRSTTRLPKTSTGLLVPVTLNLFGVLVPLHLPFQDVLAGLETSFFSSSENDGLEGPVKPSAGCWFPVSERFRRSTTRLPKTFTCLLAPIPLVKVTLKLFGVLVPLPFPFQDVLAALETSFSPLQKVTLETAVCGLEGPVKPSAGCCFPVPERFQRSTTKLPKTFTGLLVPIPLVKATLNLFGVLVPLPLAFPGRACWAFSGSEN